MDLLREDFKKYLESIKDRIKIDLLDNNDIKIRLTTFKYSTLNYQNKQIYFVVDGVWLKNEEVKAYLEEVFELKKIADILNQYLINLNKKEKKED